MPPMRQGKSLEGVCVRDGLCVRVCERNVTILDHWRVCVCVRVTKCSVKGKQTWRWRAFLWVVRGPVQGTPTSISRLVSTFQACRYTTHRVSVRDRTFRISRTLGSGLDCYTRLLNRRVSYLHILKSEFTEMTSRVSVNEVVNKGRN